MTIFGTNMKLTADRNKRAQLHAILTDALGCTTQEPAPDLVLYSLADGFLVGVYYVDDGEALDDEALRKAPWLELAVDDVGGIADKLLALGASEVDYFDDHRYFQPPGGPVFRLAARG